jgi:hypothetical protein
MQSGAQSPEVRHAKIADPGIAATLLSFSAAAQAPAFPMKEFGAVRWTCGGYGVQEREALARLEPKSDLKLVFAAGKDGAYVSQVLVWMGDERKR